ncbi:MAG: hypothetical protein KGO02_14130, partial [Alphaproteobacteria bacterium]|nr:hypothetical protein [Alphaproteobacteria bacterium]
MTPPPNGAVEGEAAVTTQPSEGPLRRILLTRFVPLLASIAAPFGAGCAYAAPVYPHVSAQLARAPGDHLPPLPSVAQAGLGPVAAATPHDAAALGHFDVLIADEGNNRLLIVSPQKEILWEYHFHGTREGGDDAFFTDHGRQIITNLEHAHFVEKIDIAQKKPVWQYGRLGYPGSTGEKLYYPDDAYQMPNGNVIVADIRNCRIIAISPDKQIV